MPNKPGVSPGSVLGKFYTNARPGQREAVDAIWHAAGVERQAEFSFELPPRYGKTDVIRASAVLLRAAGIADYVFHFVPSVILREQSRDKDDLKKFSDRYGLPLIYADEVTKFTKYFEPDPRVLVVSASIQLFVGDRAGDELSEEMNTHKRNMLALIRKVAATGKRVVIFADECQIFSTANASGKVLEEFRDAGALVITCSGTFHRTDNIPIVGAITERAGSKQETHYRSRHLAGSNTITTEVFEDLVSIYSHRPHFSVSLKTAFDEKPQILAKIDVKFIDILGIVERGDIVDEVSLREMGQVKARKHLQRAVRSEHAISEGVRIFVTELHRFRRIYSGFRGIIFCGNDRGDDGRDNHHCEQVKEEVLRRDPHLRAVVVTGLDAKAASLIKAYRKGEYDVIIVKQMGGVGLDCAEMKVMLDLSTVRTINMSAQRYLRVATVHEFARVGVVILIGDPFSRDNFHTLIERQGGMYTSEEVEESEKVDEYESEIELSEQETFTASGAELFETTNEELDLLEDPVLSARVEFLLDNGLRGVIGAARLGRLLTAEVPPQAPGEEAEVGGDEEESGDVTETRKKLVKDLDDTMLAIADFDGKHWEVEREVYQSRRREINAAVCARCGLPIRKTSEVMDVSELRQLLEAARGMLRERRKQEQQNRQRTGRRRASER